MPSSINASTTAGVVTTADTSGVLNIQTAGTTAIAIDASQAVTFTNSANLPNTFGFKNRIINGAMVIDQRNAGASVTPNQSYTLDRWLYENTQTGKVTIQQNAGAVTPPTGFTNYLGVTSTSAYSVLTGDTFLLTTRIEGYNIADLAFGTASASSITLSFWVRSSLTGTFGGSFGNASANRSYAFSYTINAANTWEQKTVSIAGDTSGTWNTTTGRGLGVTFGLGSGSTYTGTAGSWQSANLVQPTSTGSVVGTNAATWYVTGVQLEKGATATSFDYRDYGSELALCQRYAVMLGNSGDVFSNYGYGSAYTTTNVSATVSLPVPMRAIPTTSFPGSGNFMFYRGATNVSSLSANMAGGNPENTTTVGAYYFVGAGIVVDSFGKVQSSNNNTTRILFSAEL